MAGTEWHRKPKPVGVYVSIVWIPGNFFTEGNLILAVGKAKFSTGIRHSNTA
jgi:hypothetical protein